MADQQPCLVVNALKCEQVWRVLFNSGGKALQKVIGLIQFVLKEASNFLE